jgi:cell division protein FtsB
VFEGYKGTSMSPRNLNQYFKDMSVKALGENRGGQLVFKDLRDSYNEAILDSNVNEEIKDTLMGHLRESAKANYSISMGTVVRTYREKIFPRLAVNGWRLRKKASEVDELRKAVEGLRDALAQVEQENSSYKVRIDNMQTQVNRLLKIEEDREEQVERLREYIYNVVLESDDPSSEIWKIFATLPDEDFDHFIIPYELSRKKKPEK